MGRNDGVLMIGTQGGKILLKDGKVQRGCECCGGLCLSFKSEGWTGQIVDLSTAAGASGSQGNVRTSHLINGDGLGNAVIINGGSQTAATSFTLPLSYLWTAPNRLTLQIDISSALIRATFSVLVSNYIGQIVFESDEAESLVAGGVVHLTNVVSNTVPGTLDEYDNPMIDTVGSLYIKRDRVSGCDCNCSSNFYDPSLPSTTPETYTLEFTNTSDRPDGPRWKSPSTLAQAGKYSGFLPIGDFTYTRTVGIYTNTYNVDGCDSFLPRFQSPIVLRKVAGTTTQYISDPIAVRPCVKVRFYFTSCGSPYASSPLLQAVTIPSNAAPTAASGETTSFLHTPAPMCVWEAESHQQSPSGYKDYIDQFVYDFGGFATVSPGGEYSPEEQLDCGQALENNISLLEGCKGLDCPPDEIEIVITNSEIGLNGTYALPLISSNCQAPPVSSLVNQGNIFASTTQLHRTQYSATFVVSGNTFVFTVQIGGWITDFFGNTYVVDNCGCEGRQVSINFGSAQSARMPSTGGCRPACASDPPVASFWQNMRTSAGLKIGDISVEF